MNEPKKRGRPSKADIAAREAAALVVIKNTAEWAADAPRQLAQAYALRVWNGQSTSELRSWRIQRVKEALEGQGLSMEGVELPN